VLLNKIINRQLCHFFRADIGLGMAVAQGLGVNPEEAMPKRHSKETAVPV
jgi:catalase